MKKLSVLLAMVLAFTLTTMAQYDPSAVYDPRSDESSQAKSKKEATMTGCLSAQPDASGSYTLTSNKKVIKVGPADKVKAHAGHTVELTGKWSGSGKDKSLEVTNLKHIDTTCK
ncbi:MAG: hypothetical protein LAN64_03640 [Acidobacteriia bacterium]|nr:hypothetical protein [Terriglobia bacterium]